MPDKQPSKIRIDDLLVEKGLAPSLAQARALIMAGNVIANDQRIDQASTMIFSDAAVRVKKAGGKYVSRGGDKLAGALADLQLEKLIGDQVVLDVGAAAGGFTDCCLQLGARKVIALDVGTNQLVWTLRNDPRVVCLEKTDIREFKPEDYDAVDWIVADISFNSLARLLPALSAAATKATTHFLVLVKPQFELTRSEIPKGGVIEEERLQEKALMLVSKAFEKIGLKVMQSVVSKVKGRSGNIEIFLYAQKNTS
jgi:23S rRNA (cytidine1920-2'-O)/16S rRNA (cytidine1409-2'-O)-methyltransferase